MPSALVWLLAVLLVATNSYEYWEPGEPREIVR